MTTPVAGAMHQEQRQAFDKRMMAIAVRMAERGLGTTAPNPAVGAVLVEPQSGEIISRGWTQPTGRPHAEPEAIRRAGPRAKGATLYVTLEPCSHYGRTPPCADAVIEAGIARVVCAIEDPDPRVAGRGLDRLRAAGIEVTRGVEADAAHWVTLGHIARVTQRRPMIQIKMATAADGSVPRGLDGRPLWVTGPVSRAHGHMLRARADAILVGTATVADDDPELTCRLPGLAHRSPVRVILCGSTLPDTRSRLVRSAGEVPVGIVCPLDADPGQLEALRAAGCQIVPTVTVRGRPWLPAVCEALVAQGITRLLVEGGPTMWSAFHGAGFADEIFHYRAPVSRQTAVDDGSTPLGVDAALFRLANRRQIGDDELSIWRRR